MTCVSELCANAIAHTASGRGGVFTVEVECPRDGVARVAVTDDGGPSVPAAGRLELMAEERGRLVRELAEQRHAAGLSQTEVAARMGTSQSAVARLESGTADVRASTLERYAAAVGSQITWTLNRPGEGASP